MRAKRSLTAQIQEIDRIISESRGDKQAEYRRQTQLSIRETLVWLQKNEAAIKAKVSGTQNTEVGS